MVLAAVVALAALSIKPLNLAEVQQEVVLAVALEMAALGQPIKAVVAAEAVGVRPLLAATAAQVMLELLTGHKEINHGTTLLIY
jgi:hypothetical protein